MKRGHERKRESHPAQGGHAPGHGNHGTGATGGTAA